MTPPPEIRKYRRCLVERIRAMRRHKMIGVEVGVAMGETSRLLLETFANLTMFLVDTWAESPAGSAYRATGDKRSRLTNAEQRNRLEAAEQNVRFAAERAIIIQLSSVAAAEHFPHKADFVFIDGSHAYEDVRDDLAAWWPKLGTSGLFCGHDYSNSGPDHKFAGVKKAVDEFFGKKSLPLNLNSDCHVWWGYR